MFYERNFYGIIDYKNGVIDYTSSVLKNFNTASLAFLDVIDYKISQIHFYTVTIDYQIDVIDYHCHWTIYINLKCDFREKNFLPFLQNKSCDL